MPLPRCCLALQRPRFSPSDCRVLFRSLRKYASSALLCAARCRGGFKLALGRILFRVQGDSAILVGYQAR
jgi:hypothetical protein